jgi:hypothetical protein
MKCPIKTHVAIGMLTVVALTGCAARYTEPALSADHPANPDAAQVSTSAQPSHRTLDLSQTDPIASMPEGPKTRHEDHGAGHTDQHSAPDQSTGAALYVCPMHPEVTSDQPNQRCPKCGMKLKKREAGGQP